MVATTFAQSTKDYDQEVFDDKRGDVAIDQDTLDKAENAFFEGLAAYRAKKYVEAAKSFKTAHNLVPYRDLLFNIARSYEEQKKNDQAIKYYRQYLKTKPIDETQVIHRMRQLGVSQFEQKQKKKDTSNPLLKKVSPQTSDLTVDWLSWSVVGGGIALLGLGTYYGLNALDSAETARNAEINSAYAQAKDRAENEALIADVSVTLGLAALAGGLYLALTAPEASRNVRKHVKTPKAHQSRKNLNTSVAWQVIYTDQVQGFGLIGQF